MSRSRLFCQVRTIAHWFYDDGQIQALYLHLKQRLYREIDVARAMLLQPKQVGQIMVKLHQDMLLVKYDSFFAMALLSSIFFLGKFANLG